MLSKSFFISTRVRVWSRKRSFICCSRTLDSPLKLISISLVFSKRSSLFSQQFSKATIIFVSQFAESKAGITYMQVNWAQPHCTQFYIERCKEAEKPHQPIEWSQYDTHMCLWAWMIALTSSELTMLSILLQNTPDAVGSTMTSIKTKKKAANKTYVQKCIFLVRILNIIIFDTTRKLNHKINWQSQLDSVTLTHLKSSSGAVNSNC